MNTINYHGLADKIGDGIVAYREDDFVYLICHQPTQNGNILLQERDNDLIVWSNEYKDKSAFEVLSILHSFIKCDIIVPFIDTDEEYQAVIKLGGIPIDFKDQNSENYCRKYGSYLIRKGDI